MIKTKITRRTFLKRAAIAISGLMALTGGYSFAIESKWIEVTKRKVTLSSLPKSFKGLRIATFGDLHLGFHLEAPDLAPVVDKVMEQKPDLILFTGDLVDDDQSKISQSLPYLSRLKAPLGKFAVLGNHDYNGEHVTPSLLQADFQVLRNQHKVITRGQDKLVIGGIEDLLMGAPDLNQALRTSPEACTLLLSHCPDFADQIPKERVDLQISGHSHGGQIRLPFIGALITPPGGKKYVDGHYSLANTQVYVNRGIGTTILPFRFYCRPQITIIELV